MRGAAVVDALELLGLLPSADDAGTITATCPICVDGGASLRVTTEPPSVRCLLMCSAAHVREKLGQLGKTIEEYGARIALEVLVTEIERATVVKATQTEWPEPDPLSDGLEEVPTFDERLLPEELRPWLSDVAERTQCPPEYAAVGALVALAAVVGRSCAIRPKRHDDWTVIPNLWGAVVGPPASMKSPALAEALRPIKILVREATEKAQEALTGHAAALAEAKARRAVVESDMKKAAAKDGADMAELRTRYEAAVDPPEPRERRYIVNDATVEKLGELLNQNPRGLLHFRDELPGWLSTLERDGHENDRAFFLEAWNGTGGYTYDRIGRGTLHIQAACLSMLGGIQPGPLAQHLRAAVRGGSGDDGLTQRFQLLVYPDPPKKWRNVDRWPDTDARKRALAVFRRLDGLTHQVLGAAVEDDLPFLRFDSTAQALFDEWREGLMNRLLSGEEHPAIEAHLAKYPSLMPSLALLFHLADTDTVPVGPVTARSAQRAAAWCDLLEAHARRVYQVVTAENLRAARTLLGKIRAGRLPSPFGARDVYRAGWAGLTNRQVVDEALALLDDHGWVRRAEVETRGRPRTEYTAHPSLVTKVAA
jgi:putative DNA primase/helicase